MIDAAALQALIDVEDPPETVFYLSFVTETAWLGGCYVRASNPGAAIAVSHIKSCNPGGEVAIKGPVTFHDIKKDFLNRLLDEQGIEDAFVGE